MLRTSLGIRHMSSLHTSSPASSVSLERLVYTSIATEPMGTLSLFNLLNQARQRNARLGLTGHLLYADGRFTQCLEGGSEALDTLWASLRRDTRHQDIRLLSRTPLTTRRFAQWDMAFSSYRYLNSMNMPGFFPLDASGQSTQSERCMSD